MDRPSAAFLLGNLRSAAIESAKEIDLLGPAVNDPCEESTNVHPSLIRPPFSARVGFLVK